MKQLLRHLREFSSPYVAVLVVLAFSAVAVSLAVDKGWSTAEDNNPNGVWAELGKAGMQLAVVAGLGGLITAALQAAEHQREDARRRAAYRLDLAQRLRTIYGDIKRARRQLDAAGFRTAPTHMPIGDRVAAIYARELESLTEAQLAVESIMAELESEPELWCYLYTIEHRLNSGVLKEYQTHAHDLINDASSRTFSQFPQLRTFVGNAASSFKPEISVPFHIAACVLATDILQPNLSLQGAVEACAKQTLLDEKEMKRDCRSRTAPVR